MPRLEAAGCRRFSSRTHASQYPYTPSIASSASSSSSSVFSVDGRSSQSSAPSSVKSIHEDAWEHGSASSIASDESTPVAAASCRSTINIADIASASTSASTSTLSAVDAASKLSSAPCIAPELRIHPRRTSIRNTGSCTLASNAARPPPALVRQSDRKDHFVESLVDTTTHMIQVIWPWSVAPNNRDAVVPGTRNLIGLRTFIQEVLKRSKTSYSTLQVALYYLVLIRPRLPGQQQSGSAAFVPAFHSSDEQSAHAALALHCGRRMFLAALILASKYLQDRNYSARAWSKISGLRVSEINANEMAFVQAVDWKLHVPEKRFARWTEVVLKLSLHPPTPPANPLAAMVQEIDSPTSPETSQTSLVNWHAVLACLNPELDDIAMARVSALSAQLRATGLPRCNNPSVPALTRGPSAFPLPTASPGHSLPSNPPSNSLPPMQSSMSDLESLCAMQGPTVRPDALEPTPLVRPDVHRFGPFSPRLAPLPTPRMTPRPSGLFTPAASVPTGRSWSYALPAQSCMASLGDCGPNSAPASQASSSMCQAMRMAQRLSWQRCAWESWPAGSVSQKAPTPSSEWCASSCSAAASSCVAPSNVLTPRSNSPESVISDFLARPSRSSSISSSSSSTSNGLSSGSTPLVMQAARRCAERSVSSQSQDSLLMSVRNSPLQSSPPRDSMPPSMRTSPSQSSTSSPTSLSRPMRPGLNSCLGLSDPPASEDAEHTAALALEALAGSSAASSTSSTPRLSMASARKRERPLSLCEPEQTLDLTQATVRSLLNTPTPSSHRVVSDAKVASVDAGLQASTRAMLLRPLTALRRSSSSSMAAQHQHGEECRSFAPSTFALANSDGCSRLQAATWTAGTRERELKRRRHVVA